MITLPFQAIISDMDPDSREAIGLVASLLLIVIGVLGAFTSLLDTSIAIAALLGASLIFGYLIWERLGARPDSVASR